MQRLQSQMRARAIVCVAWRVPSAKARATARPASTPWALGMGLRVARAVARLNQTQGVLP